MNDGKIKKEDDPKNEDDLKNEDNLKKNMMGGGLSSQTIFPVPDTS